jgi:hypothetical protein
MSWLRFLYAILLPVSFRERHFIIPVRSITITVEPRQQSELTDAAMTRKEA